MNTHQLKMELPSSSSDGDRQTVDRLFPLVYDDLREIAVRQLSKRWAVDGLEVVELVHEAYLRMVRQRQVPEENRAHFLALAAQIMRRVLLDLARKHHAAKRGGELRRIPLVDRVVGADAQTDLLLDIDEALDRLAKFNPRLYWVVECRFFGGMTEEETAEVLQVTARTVRRDWLRAKRWLFRELDSRAAAEESSHRLPLVAASGDR